MTNICLCVQLVVGGSASGWGPLEDDFSSTNERSWLLHPGGTRMPVCGSDGEAFAFIEKSNTRYGVTTDISLGPDAFIQFDFSASCSVTSSCYSKPTKNTVLPLSPCGEVCFSDCFVCVQRWSWSTRWIWVSRGCHW